MKLGGRESKGNRTQMASFKFEVIFLFTQNREENNNNNNNKKLYQEEVVVYLVCTYRSTHLLTRREWGAFVFNLSWRVCLISRPQFPLGAALFSLRTILSRSRKVKSLSQSRESFDFSALETKVCTSYCVVYINYTLTHTHPTVPSFTTLLATHLQIPLLKKNNNSLRHTHWERQIVG